MSRRTLAGDLERLSRALGDLRQLVHFHLVSALWRAARSESFVLVLAALAIAGLVAGLLVGWWKP